MSDKHKDSRDAAEEFGDKMDDAARDVKESVDALRHGAHDKETSDGDDSDNVEVNVDVNVDK